MSANSSCSVEEVAAAARPDQVLFFQLYVNRSRSKSEALLARVEKLEFKAVVLTVDAPVGGKRTRDEKAKAVELAEDDFGVSGGEDSGSNKAGVSVAQATGR